MTNQEEWTPFKWHCSNCGHIVTESKNQNGAINVKCNRCQQLNSSTEKPGFPCAATLPRVDGKHHHQCSAEQRYRSAPKNPQDILLPDDALGILTF